MDRPCKSPKGAKEGRVDTHYSKEILATIVCNMHDYYKVMLYIDCQNHSYD